MPYSITLRSRIDATITGWYDGSRSRWSTDHRRRRLFDKAKSIREELRSLCPRNAKVINIEPEQVDDNDARIWNVLPASIDPRYRRPGAARSAYQKNSMG